MPQQVFLTIQRPSEKSELLFYKYVMNANLYNAL